MKYHLKFWSKAISRSAVIQRIYVNDDSRGSLGYFEKRTTASQRRTDSDYDRHRLAKGDDEVYTDSYSTTLATEIVEKIFVTPEIAADIASQRMSDDFARFSALQRHARGVDWIASKKDKKAAQVKAGAFAVEL